MATPLVARAATETGREERTELGGNGNWVGIRYTTDWTSTVPKARSVAIGLLARSPFRVLGGRFAAASAPSILHHPVEAAAVVAA